MIVPPKQVGETVNGWAVATFIPKEPEHPFGAEIADLTLTSVSPFRGGYDDTIAECGRLNSQAFLFRYLPVWYELTVALQPPDQP